MKIAIQGEIGSYHHIIASKAYKNHEVLCKTYFKDVHESVLSGESELGIIAVANNRYGFVHESFNEIIKNYKNIWIKEEHFLAIEHQLLGVKGSKIKDVKQIFSQSVAIEQCRSFIYKKMPEVTLVEHTDTAGSAKLISENGNKDIAAIASKQAAEIYELQVLASGIQDDKNNLTRFLTIEKNNPKNKEYVHNKFTAILKTRQSVGSLSNILLIFKNYNINITSLHSSFIPNSNFNIKFFIEFKTLNATDLEVLIKKVKEHGASLKVFGNYQAYEVA